MAQKFPSSLIELISHLKKLPGVGTKTAERFAFELLSWPKEELQELGEKLTVLKEKITPCPTCGSFFEKAPCPFCDPALRDTSQLCLLASPRDVYSIEETRSYRGLYHVIEHLLSPLDGRHAESLNLQRIEERISKTNVQELIFAFDSTLEGDATALYLKKHFSQHGLSLSRLAFGLPVGSSLEYIDGGTLSRALVGRQHF